MSKKIWWLDNVHYLLIYQITLYRVNNAQFIIFAECISISFCDDHLD